MIIKPRPPHCKSCGRSQAHAVTRESGAVVWLCPSCEYREQHPDAPLATGGIYRATARQAEVLF